MLTITQLAPQSQGGFVYAPGYARQVNEKSTAE